MLKMIALEVALVLAISGCVTVDSLNVQRSALRGSGDGGMTAVLENQDEGDVADVALGVVEVCEDILKFLETGNISDLTKGELKTELLRIVSSDSEKFVDDILLIVSVASVDVGKIGSRNVKRIRALVKGVIRGASEYTIGDR